MFGYYGPSCLTYRCRRTSVLALGTASPYSAQRAMVDMLTIIADVTANQVYPVLRWDAWDIELTDPYVIWATVTFT
jgi:hypothetical protein